MILKCDMCEATFVPGNRSDGTPNGVGFELEDGSRLTVCSSCIERTSDNPKYFDDFIEAWKRGKGK